MILSNYFCSLQHRAGDIAKKFISGLPAEKESL